MPLFRNNGVIVFFVHIPKTGGSTIERVMRSARASRALFLPKKRALARYSLQHMHAAVYLDAVERRFYDYAFAIVRNPYDRMASEYKMRVAEKGLVESFDDWLAVQLATYARNPFVLDNHIRPQTEFLSPGVEVFRLEKGIEAPIAAALDRLRLPMPNRIPHARKGSSDPICAKKESLEMVAAFYRDDFMKLDYDAGAPTSAFEVR